MLAANDANGQAVRTIVSLITNVAKDQNVRYVLTQLDDLLQVIFTVYVKICLNLGNLLKA